MNASSPPFAPPVSAVHLSRRSSAQSAGGIGGLALAVLSALVLFASVFRGGNRGVALVLIEWLALGVALALVWRALHIYRHGPVWPGGPVDRALWGLLALSPLWVGALAALSAAVPGATGFSALAGLPVAVCLVAALAANEAEAQRLRKLWLGVALAQAVFGLTQLSGIEGLFFGMPPWEPVVGTYASKNTYANLLVMAIPLAVFQWIGALQTQKHGARRAAWGWGAAVFTLVVTVMLTTSRAGISTGLIALLLSAVLLPARKPGAPAWRRWWPLAAAVLLLGAALAAGGLDWAVRFDADRLERDYDMRAVMRAAAAQGALANLPFGTGLGSFPWVSSAVQPPEIGSYWFDLAHNDYLQLLMETGVVGAALIALVFGLYIRRWVALWRWGAAASVRRVVWPREQRAAVACGIGLLAFALHAWVDYPFHIPANAMMAATLLGLMCRPGTGESNQK